VHSSKMVSVVVTGTTQGIGLGLVEQLDQRSDVTHIFATVRDPASASASDVKKLAEKSKKIHLIKLQLTEDSAAVLVLHLYSNQ
jgi:NAD(P)-dependent dehydrogenase (short-subunit alcohol dehydrogenase family)